MNFYLFFVWCVLALIHVGLSLYKGKHFSAFWWTVAFVVVNILAGIVGFPK